MYFENENLLYISFTQIAKVRKRTFSYCCCCCLVLASSETLNKANDDRWNDMFSCLVLLCSLWYWYYDSTTRLSSAAFACLGDMSMSDRKSTTTTTPRDTGCSAKNWTLLGGCSSAGDPATTPVIISSDAEPPGASFEGRRDKVRRLLTALSRFF